MRAAFIDRNAYEKGLDNVLLGSSIDDASREHLIADAIRLRPQAKAGWVDIGSREDFSSDAERVNVPVLILAGELDRVDPIAVVKEQIVPRYLSATVHFLPNKGHLLPIEAPHEVATLIETFVASLP